MAYISKQWSTISFSKPFYMALANEMVDNNLQTTVDRYYMMLSK